MAQAIKTLQPNAPLYILVKGQPLEYFEGTIVSVSQPRFEMPNLATQPGQMPALGARNVVDVTYKAKDTTYTDTIGESDTYIIGQKLSANGKIAIIAPDKDTLLTDLRATMAESKKAIEEAPLHEKRIKECEALISQLDTAFAEKQVMETRLRKLEDNNTKMEQTLSKNNELLEKLIRKIEK